MAGLLRTTGRTGVGNMTNGLIGIPGLVVISGLTGAFHLEVEGCLARGLVAGPVLEVETGQVRGVGGGRVQVRGVVLNQMTLDG